MLMCPECLNDFQPAKELKQQLKEEIIILKKEKFELKVWKKRNNVILTGIDLNNILEEKKNFLEVRLKNLRIERKKVIRNLREIKEERNITISYDEQFKQSHLLKISNKRLNKEYKELQTKIFRQKEILTEIKKKNKIYKYSKKQNKFHNFIHSNGDKKNVKN